MSELSNKLYSDIPREFAWWEQRWRCVAKKALQCSVVLLTNNPDHEPSQVWGPSTCLLLLPSETCNLEQDQSPTVKCAVVLFLIQSCPWLTWCCHSSLINTKCLPVYAHSNLLKCTSPLKLAQDLLKFINSWHYHVFLHMLCLIDSTNISFLHASGCDYCRCQVAFCRAAYRLFASLLHSHVGTNFHSIWRFKPFPIPLRNDDLIIATLVS